MNKFIPPIALLAVGIYFLTQESDSVPSEILTTWRTGTEHRMLTLYKGDSNNKLDGYFFNSKSGRLEGMVKSTYDEGTLTGHWFQVKNKNKCATLKYGTFYWGQFQLNISEKDFKGKWSYCNKELGGSWNGRRYN